MNDEIVKAEEAKRLLEHPILVGAFSAVHDGLVATLGRSGLGDTETHHNIAIALQLLEQIKRQFKEVIETGEMTAIQVRESNLQKLRKVVGF